ncbi:MAG: hypothetical protein ACJAYX_003566, partial [Planctomycetota bacterium]
RAHGYKYFKAYGSPKVDDRDVPVTSSKLDDAGTTLHVQLPELREGDVYTFTLAGLTSRTTKPLLGDKVYYTLLKKR